MQCKSRFSNSLPGNRFGSPGSPTPGRAAGPLGWIRRSGSSGWTSRSPATRSDPPCPTTTRRRFSRSARLTNLLQRLAAVARGRARDPGRCRGGGVRLARGHLWRGGSPRAARAQCRRVV